MIQYAKSGKKWENPGRGLVAPGGKFTVPRAQSVTLVALWTSSGRRSAADSHENKILFVYIKFQVKRGKRS